METNKDNTKYKIRSGTPSNQLFAAVTSASIVLVVHVFVQAYIAVAKFFRELFLLGSQSMFDEYSYTLACVFFLMFLVLSGYIRLPEQDDKG